MLVGLCYVILVLVKVNTIEFLSLSSSIIINVGGAQGPLYDEVTDSIPGKEKFTLEVNSAYGKVRR